MRESGSFSWSVISFIGTVNSDPGASQAAREVGASQDALVDLFGRIETFFERLETYVQVRPTEAMKNLVIKIMVEILGILAIATKETKRRWASELVPRKIYHLTDRSQRDI